MKFNALGARALDGFGAGIEAMGRHVRSLVLVLDDIVKTVLDALFLNREMERAKVIAGCAMRAPRRPVSGSAARRLPRWCRGAARKAQPWS